MEHIQKGISEEYQEFVAIAEKLADNDKAKYPDMGKNELPRDRFIIHLIGMLEMYSIRYGGSFITEDTED